MKIGVVIQARMGSTRMPGKVMKKIFDRTVLEHDIQRVQQAKNINDIIIATTILEQDNIIYEEAIKCGVKAFRGSEEDVLDRYYYASCENHLDIIVRITSDCPLIDPNVLDEIIQFYKENNYDIVSNAGANLNSRTYPRGLDIEIFSFDKLEEAFFNAKEKYQREHVTPYIYENTQKIYYYKNDVDYSMHRWTLDTEEDFELINKIYNNLYKGKHNFYLNEIVNLFKLKPELYDINSHIEQKKIK